MNIEVAAELQGRDTLDGVHEDGDGGKVIADRQFPAGENGAGSDAELLLTSFALPNAARRVGVNRRALAMGAEGRAAVVGKPDRHEGGVGIVVGHAEDAREAQRAGLGGKEEVLSHN